MNVKTLKWSNGFAHTPVGLMFHMTSEQGCVVLEKHAGSSVIKTAVRTKMDAVRVAQEWFNDAVMDCLQNSEPNIGEPK